MRYKKIELTQLHVKGRRLRRWCLAHPPQTVLLLMTFVMISSYIDFWLAWFALACFCIGSIGLICLMLHDFVREERAQHERRRQRTQTQRQATRRMQEKLAALRAGKFNAACRSPETQSGQDES